MNTELTRTIQEMFAVMDQVKAGAMGADDAHAVVRAGAVVVKAHEVALQREIWTQKLSAIPASYEVGQRMAPPQINRDLVAID